ncbi:MAG: ABC transporter ATP-binding protein [Verrucomicrobiota bacterium]|nr:ABC transporter ATP-binding protein [Verrucomicrobiota bacterium]
MSEVVLSARDVRKSYHIGGKELPVLQGVSMDLHQGEFVALQGASGSGKSTLLQLLGGLDRSSSGSILFDESPLQIQTPSQSARFRGQHVGFIFQAYHLLPDLVALENVMLPAQVQRLSQSVIEDRARDLLDKVGLNERMNHRPSELSGGEQQRVAIARALMNEPDIVLADEPTGNLDSVTELEIIKLLKHLHEESRLTLMVATHDEKVAEAAQRVVCLKDGKVC